MSVRTDALLFYGFEMTDEDIARLEILANDLGTKLFEWETLYAAKMGIHAPYIHDEHHPTQEESKAFHDYLVEVNKRTDTSVFMDCHGHLEGCPVYYVALKQPYYTAHRGYSSVIENLDVPTDAHDDIKAFCDIMGVDYQEPKWILASYTDF